MGTERPSPAETPSPPEYFDYRADARSAGISGADLSRIIRLFERDYPYDLMLRELHVLRACLSIGQGRTRLSDVLADAA